MQDGASELHDDERLARLIRLSARGFNRALSLRLQQHDVTFGQWIFLRILWVEDGLSQRELSQRANVTEPTTHTALKKLELQGLIRRDNPDDNRRRQHTYLTEQGKALRAVLEPLAIEANEVAAEGLSATEREDFRRYLLILIRNLERDEAEASKKGLKVPPKRGWTGDV